MEERTAEKYLRTIVCQKIRHKKKTDERQSKIKNAKKTRRLAGGFWDLRCQNAITGDKRAIKVRRPTTNGRRKAKRISSQ